MKRADALKFAKELVATYKRHGGRVLSDNPFVLENIPKGPTPGNIISELLGRIEKNRKSAAFLLIHCFSKFPHSRKKTPDAILHVTRQDATHLRKD